MNAEKNWLATQRSELSSFMDDRCVQETTKQKKGTTVFEVGGGGGGGAGVWKCAKLTLRE